MSDIQHEVATEVAARQAAITAAREELEALEEDAPQFERGLAQLVQAVNELLVYEATIPAKLEEPHRQVSIRLLTVVTRVHLASAIVLGLLPLTGWVSWSWEWAAGLQAVVSLVTSTAKPPVERHRRLRGAAAVLSVLTVAVPLMALGVLPRWLTVFVAVGWVAGFVLAHGGGEPAGQSGKAAA